MLAMLQWKQPERLAQHGRLFWNVIGSVFHYICVLLAHRYTYGV